MIQCPKCKRILKNGRYIDFKLNFVIPGISYRLCPKCRNYLK